MVSLMHILLIGCCDASSLISLQASQLILSQHYVHLQANSLSRVSLEVKSPCDVMLLMIQLILHAGEGTDGLGCLEPQDK